MDVSLEYVEMCEKAEEIQELGNALRMDSKSIFVDGGKRQIWLPRQDDLQEMVFSVSGSKLDIFGLHCFWQFADQGGMEQSDSMEQLWLAYVMWEKFGKQWDEGKWVKEG